MSKNLTELELQYLRHLIGAHETISNKLSDYAKSCTDQELCQILQCDSKDALNSKEKLMTFLQ